MKIAIMIRKIWSAQKALREFLSIKTKVVKTTVVNTPTSNDEVIED